MQLEGLIEQASRRVPAAESGQQQAVQPMDGLLLLRQDAPSSFEASLYAPVLCLILQGRKQVSIGERTLSFGPGECLLVSHDLPVCSRITKAPYLALIFEVDVSEHDLEELRHDLREVLPTMRLPQHVEAEVKDD